VKLLLVPDVLDSDKKELKLLITKFLVPPPESVPNSLSPVEMFVSC